MKMYKFAFLVMSCLCLGNSFLPLAHAQEENGSQGKRIILSASEYGYPPFCIVNDEGQAAGFSVELLRAALKAMNYDVTFKVGPWGEVKKSLEVGAVEVLPMVGRTPEREKIFDFTVPYFTLHGAIFVRENDTSIVTFDDLAGKEIVVMSGDNAEEFIRRKNITPNIIATATFEEAMRLLASGKHDAVVAQRLMGLKLLEELKIKNVYPLPEVLSGFTQDFCFAVQENNKDLLAILNEGLALIYADGTYAKIYQKWVQPIFHHAVSFQDVLKYLVIVIPLIFFSVLLAAAIIFRFQLNKKTRHLEDEMRAGKKKEEENIRLQKQLFHSQKLEAVGVMANGIAHNFNNILAAVSGRVELALKDAPPDGRIYSDLKKAIEGVSEAKKLSDQMLSYSRQEKGKLEQTKIQIVLEEVIELLKGSVESSIEIRKNIDVNCAPILVDPDEIKHVVMNLCINACHAMPKSGGVLEVGLNEVEVDDDLEAKYFNLHKGKYLRIGVKDNGSGMDEEVKSRIFEPFFTTKEVGKGTGLGLSLVHRTVMAYKGEIFVDSYPGEGTTVTIYLPVDTARI